MQNDNKVVKRRAISAQEYIELQMYKIKGMQTLEYSRLCTMKDDLYMIIDYYPNVETQPMICIV